MNSESRSSPHVESQSVPPGIDFDIEDFKLKQDIYNECWSIWPRARPWLESHGYYLYEETYPAHPQPPPSDACTANQHPYATYPAASSLEAFSRAQVVLAQDASGRHVVLKLCKDGSVEPRIYEMLACDKSLLDVQNFPGVLPPLGFLQWGSDHCVVILPRWEDQRKNIPWFQTVAEVLEFMRYNLRGLSYLHRHCIAHRDLAIRNTLLNFFGDSVWCHKDDEARLKFRQTDKVLYAIFDFDLAVVLPAGPSTPDGRLPFHMSDVGSIYDRPHDTAQGEFDFDPFAWDVACLGIVFCTEFQHLTGTIPFLAPLLDKMVAHDVHRRFTAEDALAFLEMHAASAPHDARVTEPTDIAAPYKTYDRWAPLPTALVQDWSYLREQCPSRVTLLLRRVCERSIWAERLIRAIRRKFAWCCPFT